MSQLQLTAARRCNELGQKHFPDGLTPAMIRLMDDVREQIMAAFLAGEANATTLHGDRWSNQSCFGYTIMAAERVGLIEHDTFRLVSSLHRIFDEVSLEEAAKRYISSPY